MTNLAHILPSSEGVPAAYLGPAEITDIAALGVSLQLTNGDEVMAQIALAFGYQPLVGDSVLCIGNDDGHYVIGVLATQGSGRLTFQGDLELAASGTLHLRGEDGVAIEGPEVHVRAGKLEMMARAVTQRFERVRQHVSDVLSVHAGKTHTVVDGPSYTRAQSSTLLTEEKVSINGKSIYLG